MISEIFTSFGKFVGPLNNLILPKSKDPDLARRELILNILLFSAAMFIFSGLVIHVIFWNTLHFIDAQAYANNTMPLGTLCIIFSFFIALFLLSRRGFFGFSSYTLLAVFYFLASYMEYRWGVDLPSAILLNTVVVIMAGILINTNFAFITTSIIAITMGTIGYFQQTHFISVNHYWKNEMWIQTDLVMIVVIYFIIATVSWLSNREIEKSLVRARKSEAELKAERDSLEIKVEERTKELKEAQLEKMAQLYRFAEFGRLSSGLFHDLVNPLNAISLNMEKVKNQEGNFVGETKKYLDKAISATRKMEDFIMAVRKQISKDENKTLFSVNEEVKEVIGVLSYKALKAKVKIVLSSTGSIKTEGDAIKFSQVALNLIANAIDSYGELGESHGKDHREVKIFLTDKDGIISLTVKDYGEGIPKEHFDKLFEPFFTTKHGKGMGLGLSMVKRITENNFHGTIEVESEKNKGTTFIIKFPKIHE